MKSHPTPMLECRETCDRAEWSCLLERASDPHMVQSWAYGEAKRSQGWRPRRIVIARAGEPVAAAQILDRRWAGVRLVSRVNRGPLRLQGSDADLPAIYRALRGVVPAWPLGPLLIAPAETDGEASRDALRAAGYWPRRDLGWCSSRLDLTLAPDELRRRLRSTWRNQLRAAEGNGLVFVAGDAPADVDWMVGRHASNMLEKGFVGPAPAFVAAMASAAGAEFVVCRVLHEGVAVAGLAAVRSADLAECFVGWFGVAGRKLYAGNFLLWNTALEMRRRGCRLFDLGGYSSIQATGYGRFKRGMGGTEYRLAGEWVAT